jgi:hypothetical protein
MKLPALLSSSALLFVAAASAQNGVPYSAQRVTERVQTLVDGTVITQKPHKVNEYRDSLGRSRTEELSPETDEIVSANISDPLAGFRYSLDLVAHTARRWSLATPPKNSASPAQKQADAPQISRDSLGTQTIEGLLVQGTRTTTVYPVAAFGNDRPLTVTTETWRSSELRAPLLLKISDPRSGETTIRLTNISRSEPDPSLFQVPAGYEITDAGPSSVPRRLQ